MTSYEEAWALLPAELRSGEIKNKLIKAEELRLRVGRNISLVQAGREYEVGRQAVREAHLRMLLEKATGASLHTNMEAMSQGYISYKGLRIGVCGTVAVSQGQLLAFRQISSLNIRIPKELKGICDAFLPELLRPKFQNTLIISPPGAGKTSLLRDIIRRLSDSGRRVSVLDERGELSCRWTGLEGYDLGRCSDVIVGLAKAQGATMLLRAMNPEIIAMDEITASKDGELIEEILGCGVGILATAHSRSLKELRQRKVYKELLEKEVFKKLIRIELEAGERRYALEEI